MDKTNPTIVASALALFALASCGSTPQVTRAPATYQQNETASLSRVGRVFHKNAPATVNFDFDVDLLDAAAMQILDAQAAWIQKYPNLRFSVYGHTDKVGTVDYNDDLGMRRANSVLGYIVTKGVNPARLEAIVSLGETSPVIFSEGPSRENRRVTTFVAGVFKPVSTAIEDEDPYDFGLARKKSKPSKKRPKAPGNTAPEESTPAGTPPATTPPASNPPAATSPAATPPASTPPAATPPASTPPAATPPANTPPAATPPANTPPAADPPANTPPAADPPANTPPADDPPGPSKPSKDDNPNKDLNAGRGDGSETGDPGNSGKNKGGDE